MVEPKSNPSPFVFTTKNGNLLNRRNVVRRNLADVCKRAGLKDRGITPKAFRHAMTSHAYANGESLLAIAARLGHTNPTMILRRYGHALPGAQARIAKVLEEQFSGPTASAQP